MGAGGKDGVILAVLSCPKMRGKAYISALPSLLKKQMQKRAYRAYVTDALKIIGENTAKYVGGSYMKVRYDAIENPPPEETRDSKEIIDGMKAKIARIGG